MFGFLGKLFLGLMIVVALGSLFLVKKQDVAYSISTDQWMPKDLVSVPRNNNYAVNLNIRIRDRKSAYKMGERMSFSINTDKSGYITLWDIGTSNRVTRIFPNKFSPESMYVNAGETSSIGGESTSFDFKVTGKSGFEDVYAIWTENPTDQPNASSFKSSISFAKDLIAFKPRSRKSWASDKVSFEIVGEEVLAVEEPSVTGKHFSVEGKVYIVAMGANVQNLTKTNQDARHFSEQLQLMFPQGQVETEVIENVTKKQFIGALKHLRTVVKPNDLVFIYFSGHGLLQADHNNGDEEFDAFFVTYDVESLGSDGSFILNDAVSDDEFAYHVNRIPTDNIISVIDACHSGGMQKGVFKGHVKYFNGKLKGAFVPPDTLIVPQSNTPIPVIDNAKGLVFAATEENEQAIEVYQGGIFTNALLAEMRNAQVNDNLMDIFMNTKRVVKKVTDREQIPTFVGEMKIAEGLGLVAARGGAYSLR